MGLSPNQESNPLVPETSQRRPWADLFLHCGAFGSIQTADLASYIAVSGCSLLMLF